MNSKIVHGSQIVKFGLMSLAGLSVLIRTTAGIASATPVMKSKPRMAQSCGSGNAKASISGSGYSRYFCGTPSTANIGGHTYTDVEVGGDFYFETFSGQNETGTSRCYKPRTDSLLTGGAQTVQSALLTDSTSSC